MARVAAVALVLGSLVACTSATRGVLQAAATPPAQASQPTQGQVQAVANSINRERLQQAQPQSASGGGTATATTAPYAGDTYLNITNTNHDAPRSIAYVNAHAPTFKTPGGQAIKPVLSSANSLSGISSAKGLSASGGDGEQISGDYIANIVGVRVATPFFGSGFNICVDRYFGTFPKVGIVLPNVAAFIIPDLQNLASSLYTTLDLPGPNEAHGLTFEPAADGFFVSLPQASFQPNEVPNFALRYGIQIGQALGLDFGYGIIKDTCFVDFVIV